MNFRKLILTAAVVACTSGAAMAQTKWSGFYIGANAGYGWSHSHVATTTVYSPGSYFATTSVPSINNNGAAKLKPEGFTGGITAGYNFQFSRFLLGIEADHNYNNTSDTRSVTVTYPCCATTGYTLKQDVSMDHVTTVRARFGWAGDKVMVYGTAGGARTTLDFNELFTDTYATANEFNSFSHKKTAFVYGAGAEFTVSGHWSMKLDYLHANFGGATHSDTTLTTVTAGTRYYWPANVFTHSADLRMDTVRFGVNYRF